MQAKTMYDKVKFILPTTADTHGVVRHLEGCKQQNDMETGETCVFGGFGGMKITVSICGITIIGSLAKFYYPSNVWALDRRNTALAVEKLADGLHVPMDYARVVALEFGDTFVMRLPVGQYLPRFGDMPRMERLPVTAGSLYYQTGGRQHIKSFVFYDKGADAAAKGLAIPPGLADANLLRYEMRYHSRLARQLGMPVVTAADLSELGFYSRMARLYKDSYFSIRKQTKTQISMEGIDTVKGAFEAFAGYAIAQLPPDKVTGFVEEVKAANRFTHKSDYTRLKKKLQDAAAKGEALPDELVREMDEAIINATAYV